MLHFVLYKYKRKTKFNTLVFVVVMWQKQGYEYFAKALYDILVYMASEL